MSVKKKITLPKHKNGIKKVITAYSGGWKRQTYFGRETRGRAGWYPEDAKVLLRYDKYSNFINNIQNDIGNMLTKLSYYNREILEYGLQVTIQELNKLVPVDTGALKNSIDVRISNKNDFVISSNIGYMLAQNYGKYGEPNGNNYAFYPGYYFAERAMHKALIEMKNKAKELGIKIGEECSK